MSSPTGNRLKLHRVEELEVPPPDDDALPGFTSLVTSFREMTGWVLDYEPAGEDGVNGAEDGVWSRVIEAQPGTTMGVLTLRKYDPSPTRCLPLKHVTPLANSVGALLCELARTQHVVWQREAELAAGVPISRCPDEERHLAERLEGILRSAVEVVGGNAAALYLLDDATSELKLRSSWGLPRQRLLQPARPLRGALADLEALLGNAVVLEDFQLFAHWKPPEPFASGVCLPVSSSTNPLGTLWLFSDQKRDYSSRDTQVLEVVTGRIAAELQRAILLQQGIRRREVDRQILRAASWQRLRYPTIEPMLDDWQVAGWTRHRERLGGGFHDWFVLSDGKLAMAVGQTAGDILTGSLAGAATHAALRAHAAHPHSPLRLLKQLNETVWTSSAGDHLASLGYAILDPDRQRLGWALADRAQAVVVGPQGCWTFEGQHPALGIQPEGNFWSWQRYINSQEVLILTAGHPTRYDPCGGSHPLARRMQELCRLPADQIADQLEAWYSYEGPTDRTLIVLRRGDAS